MLEIERQIPRQRVNPAGAIDQEFIRSEALQENPLIVRPLQKGEKLREDTEYRRQRQDRLLPFGNALCMRPSEGRAGVRPLRKPFVRRRSRISGRLAITWTGTSHDAFSPLTAAAGS